MIHDALNLFSDAQSVTTGSENGVLSTNVVDLGSAGRNIGVGENVYVVIQIDTAMTSSGSDDIMTVALVTDDNASLSSPAVVQTLGVFAAISAIGSRIIARLQPGTYERYIGLKYTASAGPLTAGAFTAFLTHDIDAYTSYPKGYTIS